MKLNLQWLKIQLFLLRVTAHANIPLYLQLFWAAVEKIFKVCGMTGASANS